MSIRERTCYVLYCDFCDRPLPLNRDEGPEHWETWREAAWYEREGGGWHETGRFICGECRIDCEQPEGQNEHGEAVGMEQAL